MKSEVVKGEGMKGTTKVAGLMLVLALMASATMSASTVFNFTDTGDGISISGTIVGNDNGNGTFTIISGSGLFNGSPIALLPGSGGSPLGSFTYDSLLFPGGDPALDNSGLLFLFNGTNELNIWGTEPGVYSTYTSGAPYSYPLQNDATLFTLTQSSTPEPGTMAMLGVGLALAAIGGWRRKKAQTRA